MAGIGATEADDRLNYARSTTFVYTLGQRTMLQAFSWLYKGGPLNSHPGYSNKMDTFTRKQIKSGMLPSEMDITSLYQVLQRMCDLAPDNSAWTRKPSSAQDTTLEQALYQLKNSRFRLAHPRAEGYIKVSDIQLDDLMRDLRCLYTKVLRLAGKRAAVKQDEVEAAVSKMHEDFKQQRDAESGFTEEEFLKMSRHDLQSLFVSPTSYYLPPQLVVENEEASKPTHIPLTELFCQTCKDGSLPELIIVEGETGSGKTSLCRYLMNSWLTDPSIVQQLGRYQLVVIYDCGRINTRDVHYLLCTRILPMATSSCSGGELSRILEKLKILWLLDSLEEAAPEGRVFLQELLQTQPSSHTILVASRREQSALLTSSTFPKKKYLKASLIELNDDEREMILRNQMPPSTANNTEKSIEEFIVYMRGSDAHLRDVLRNPLRLMLAAKLWCEDPSRFNPKSSLSELYMDIKDSYTKQLVRRVKERTGSYDDAQKKIDKWFGSFCKVAFKSVKEESTLKLNTRNEELLRQKVDESTASQCLSTFLEFRPSPDDTPGKGCYVFSHYSQQCFYAALYLNFTCSLSPDPDGEIKNVFKGISGNVTTLIDPYLGIYDVFNEIFDISMILASRVSFGWFCPQMKLIGFCQSLQRLGRKIITLARGTNPIGHESRNMNRYYPVLLHVLEMKAVGCFTAQISAETLGNLIFMLHDEVSPQKCFEVVRSFHYQEDLIREVARRMKTDLWKVADIDLKAAWELLSYIIPKEIIITISKDPAILSDLEILLFILARKHVRVHLHLKRHYQFLGSKGLLSDKYVTLLCDNDAKCQFVSFRGCLSSNSIERLKNSSWLKNLSLRVTNVSAINSLCSVTPKLRRLWSLDLIYDCPKFVTLDSPLDGSLGFRKFIDGTISILMLKGSKPLNVSLYLPHLVDASAPAAVNFISSLSKCYLSLCVGTLGHSGGKKLIYGLEQKAVHVANLLKPTYIKEIGRSILVRLGSLPLEVPVKEFVGQWHDISKINI